MAIILFFGLLAVGAYALAGPAGAIAAACFFGICLVPALTLR
jgi:hypothetical protein